MSLHAPTRSLKKCFWVKLVPGTKKVGDHWSSGLFSEFMRTFMTNTGSPQKKSLRPVYFWCCCGWCRSSEQKPAQCSWQTSFCFALVFRTLNLWRFTPHCLQLLVASPLWMEPLLTTDRQRFYSVAHWWHVMILTNQQSPVFLHRFLSPASSWDLDGGETKIISSHQSTGQSKMGKKERKHAAVRQYHAMFIIFICKTGVVAL